LRRIAFRTPYASDSYGRRLPRTADPAAAGVKTNRSARSRLRSGKRDGVPEVLIFDEGITFDPGLKAGCRAASPSAARPQFRNFHGGMRRFRDACGKQQR
jgi:hypothetical protein